MDRRARRGRGFDAALLLVSIIPGWAFASGLATTMYLFGHWQWNNVPFLVGGAVAVLTVRIGHRFMDEKSWPVGEIPWFSEVAADLYLTRGYLEWRSQAVGLPSAPVLALAWAPWFGFVGWWIFAMGSFFFHLLLG